MYIVRVITSTDTTCVVSGCMSNSDGFDEIMLEPARKYAFEFKSLGFAIKVRDAARKTAKSAWISFV